MYLTEELTTSLSRLPDGFVLAHDSLHLSGKSLDAKKIGKELGVHYALEGSVQKSGGACGSTPSSLTP